MITRFPSTFLGFVVVLALADGASGQERTDSELPRSEANAAASEGEQKGKPGATENAPRKVKPGTLQVATFGGGCFWCTEAVCEQVPGVRSVVSGYAGGIVPFPTYEAVCTGMTGHAEVVQIVFDASIISYEKLLEVFWRSHDPTTPNAQGPDVGTQYRSIIFYHNDEQKKAAQKVYQALKARRVLRGIVVTELVPFRGFYPAEPYHQDYYSNHPFDPYSMVYIAPKFDVFRKMMMKGKSTVKVGGRPGTTPGKDPRRAAEPKEAAETVANDQNRPVPEKAR
jgi:peptide-methionine (S)-S-oxide reductase